MTYTYHRSENIYKRGEGKQELLKKCGTISQIARANRYTFSEGRARGLDAVDVNNGSGLNFTVLLGRNLDIHWCEYGGELISFILQKHVSRVTIYPR